MATVYTNTQDFDINLRDQFVIANSAASTGTLAVQIAVGAEWITVGTVAAGEAKNVLAARSSLRILITGSVSYSIY